MAGTSSVRMVLGTTLTVLMVHVLVTEGTVTKTCTIDSRPHHRGLCGTVLVETVQNVCSTFNPQRLKRDTSEVDNPLAEITLDKPSALTYLTKREYISGFVCECCNHHCSLWELLDHCPNSQY